jgi:hypothetical protein
VISRVAFLFVLLVACCYAWRQEQDELERLVERRTYRVSEWAMARKIARIDELLEDAIKEVSMYKGAVWRYG